MGPSGVVMECCCLGPLSARMSLTERIYVLDKLHSDLSYSAISSELNVNESNIHI